MKQLSGTGDWGLLTGDYPFLCLRIDGAILAISLYVTYAEVICHQK
jgi:hypothetical protein